ncbi:MAG TPA: hypothetical protein VK891_07150 [Euzebyales bacterium]|nr:hypothetical protein [Euzebyales bacterium]
MLLRRLLALTLAVGLVLGAMQVRERFFGEAGAGALTPSAPDDLRVACAIELTAVCAELDLATPALVEEAGATVERFGAGELPFDVWLTLDPWPQLAADARTRSGQGELAEARSDVLARSPVVIAALRGRVEVMNDACGGAVSWSCLAEHAGTPYADIGGEAAWGRVRVGLDHPAERAGGLLALAQATGSFFEGAAYDTRTLAAADFFAWLSELAAAADSDTQQSPFERMLLTGGADYQFAGVLESVAAPLLARAPGRADDIAVLRPEPVVTADVVAVGYGEQAQAAVDQLAERVAGPLAAQGWRVAGAEMPSELEAVALPDGNGLPSAATLETLRQTWDEVTP